MLILHPLPSLASFGTRPSFRRALVVAEWAVACIIRHGVLTSLCRKVIGVGSPRVRRAILSVSDKTGLAEFARALAALSVELFSTGGTRRSLEEAGLKVQDISA